MLVNRIPVKIDFQFSSIGWRIQISEYSINVGAVKPSCHIQTNQCGGAVPPCHNNGICSEGWNRPLCDCTATLYNGPTCGRESTTLAFNGTQHMTIWLGGAQGSRTQTEELVLRFKTARAAGLLLLTSAESESPDRLEISLVAGRVRASVRLGDREKVIVLIGFCCCRFLLFSSFVYSKMSLSTLPTESASRSRRFKR